MRASAVSRRRGAAALSVTAFATKRSPPLAARPVLSAYGDPVLHVGPLGAGQGVKLVNNAAFAADIGLLAPAAKLAAEFGVEESVLLSPLPHGSSASFALSAAARGSVTALADGLREFLGTDVAVVRDAAADLGASPLLASDHSTLPPALIQVAEHDPLRDDGMRYADALRAAGGSVRLTGYVGMPHGFMNFPGPCRSAPQALAEICAEQKLALA